MKKVNIFLVVLVSSFLSIVSCDTYPDYKIEYTATYPLNGEYYVKNYAVSSTTPLVPYYRLLLYNGATSGKDSIWVDLNAANGSSTGFYKFKVKSGADVPNTTFDAQGLKFGTDVTVSIQNSKVLVNQWPTPDSIYFTVRFQNSATNVDSTYFVAGYRRTGFEENMIWDE